VGNSKAAAEAMAAAKLQLEYLRHLERQPDRKEELEAYLREAIQKFMVESSCCPATKRTRVVSVERVENEFLWKMYQLKKKEIERDCAAQGIHSLSTATKWQPAWFCNVKKEKGKGCGKCSQGHTLSVISSSNSWQCDVCSSACNYNPRLRCHYCGFDMCIKCAKAEAEAKEQAAVEAKTAAEAKARAEAEEKAAAEKAAGGRGLLRYTMPSCFYGGGCDIHRCQHDTMPSCLTPFPKRRRRK